MTLSETNTSSQILENKFQLSAYKAELNASSDSSDDEYLSPAYAEMVKAVTNGNLAMVKQMVEYGLNVNYIYDRDQNYSFLHLACLMGHSKVVKYLLDCGANANFVTADGHQPIDFIESDDMNTISYMLLKMNAQKNGQ